MSHRSRQSKAWVMRALRVVAIGLIVLVGLQSVGSRALLLCLCEPGPQLELARTDCCASEQPCGDVVDTSEPADACTDCVVMALTVDDTVVHTVPVLAALVMRPHWAERFPPSRVASSARMAVLPRPPPLPNPALLHLSTVHLTI